MTNQLYNFNKPKTPIVHKILGYASLILFLSINIILILIALLTGSQDTFSLNLTTWFFVSFIVGAQVLMLFLKTKNKRTSQKTFDKNMNEGSINIPRALTPLTPEQTRVLERLHSYSYSAHRAFWLLIPIFLLFDGFILFAVVRSGFSFFILFPIIFTLTFQGAIIHYGRRHYSYYLDLISPVFYVKGECTDLSLGNSPRLLVNGVRFIVDYNQDTAIQNQVNQISVGDILEITYSPHSKYIWSLQKVGI